MLSNSNVIWRFHLKSSHWLVVLNYLYPLETRLDVSRSLEQHRRRKARILIPLEDSLFSEMEYNALPRTAASRPVATYSFTSLTRRTFAHFRSRLKVAK